MSVLLARYRAGEHERVWGELLSGKDVNGGFITDPEAQDVAQETMDRVRRNVETLVERLSALGYRFGLYPDGTPMSYHRGPLLPPSPDINEQIARLKSFVGPVPLSLRTFWRVVGSVNLIGCYPKWPDVCWDPLFVYPIEVAFLDY